MSGYNYLSQVTDPAAQRAIKALIDRVAKLETQLTTLQGAALTNTAAINANSQRVTSVADPQNDQDAATRKYVQSYVAAQLEAFKV